jgi:hypothetical protein
MSKNNPENRGQVTKLREHQGKTVKPVLYFGKHQGHGNYIAAAYETGDLVVDAYGRPIPYQSC